MPDQFGNPTPAEILAHIVVERDQILEGARTPYEQRNANLLALGKTISMGMDPRVVNARNIQNALSKSLALTRTEGESAIDYEIRRGRQMFEDVKNVDPTTAADISGKLVELEAERAQQERLKAEDQRDEQRFVWEGGDHDQKLKERKSWDLTQGLFYEVDPKTGKTTGESTSIDDTDHLVKVNEVRQRGNILITADDINAAHLNADAADYKLLGSDLAATKNQVQGVIENVGIAKNLMQLFLDAGAKGDNPQTFADTIARGVQPIVNAVSEGQKALGLKPAPPVGSPEFNEDVSIFEKELQRRGLQSQVPTSLLVQLAYTWAKSFDNRVTEQDFLNAYNMLGAGSGSPAQVAATVREMTFGRHESMMKTTGTVVNDLMEYNKDNTSSLGYKQGQSLRSLLDVYEKDVGTFREKSDALLKMYGGADRHSPAPAGGERSNERTVNGRKFVARPGGQ